MNTPIHDFLLSYASQTPVRCHTPGGKDNPLDITEIDGADSLFECSGIIKESEENAAALFGAEKTLYSCGGSTLAIQTMLALAKAYAPQKKRVAASRYCHKSLVSACVLLNLEIDWIEPPSLLSCEIAPKAVEGAINNSTLCVFAQSVDYYGGECDISAISEICKKHGLPFLVDNAHGAYRVFTHNHPLLQGADMTADSAHKTLPCLTGGAYLHISKNAPKIFSERAKEMMSLFGSSSPSYLILNSLDACNRHIALEKEKALNTMEKIRELKASLEKIGFTLRKSDLMRITLDAEKYGYSGVGLSREFAKNNVTCEFADQKYMVMLFSTSQPLTDFPKILEAAKNIPKKAAVESPCLSLPASDSLPHSLTAPLPASLSSSFSAPLPASLSIPKTAMPLTAALFSQSEEIPLNKAKGRICTSVIAPCPPGVPVIMPGEIFSEREIRALDLCGVEIVRVAAEQGLYLGE